MSNSMERLRGSQLNPLGARRHNTIKCANWLRTVSIVSINRSYLSTVSSLQYVAYDEQPIVWDQQRGMTRSIRNMPYRNNFFDLLRVNNFAYSINEFASGVALKFHVEPVSAQVTCTYRLHVDFQTSTFQPKQAPYLYPPHQPTHTHTNHEFKFGRPHHETHTHHPNDGRRFKSRGDHT
jgi:hypothetical protein